VFAGEVDTRTRKDTRLQALTQAMNRAEGAAKRRLWKEWNELYKTVHSEKLGEVATEFDHVHSVHSALQVDALNEILPPANLRPFLIASIERGIKGELESWPEREAAKERVAAAAGN